MFTFPRALFSLFHKCFLLRRNLLLFLFFPSYELFLCKSFSRSYFFFARAFSSLLLFLLLLCFPSQELFSLQEISLAFALSFALQLYTIAEYLTTNLKDWQDSILPKDE